MITVTVCFSCGETAMYGRGAETRVVILSFEPVAVFDENLGIREEGLKYPTRKARTKMVKERIQDIL